MVQQTDHHSAQGVKQARTAALLDKAHAHSALLDSIQMTQASPTAHYAVQGCTPTRVGRQDALIVMLASSVTLLEHLIASCVSQVSMLTSVEQPSVQPDLYDFSMET